MALHQYQKAMYKKAGVVMALVILPIAGFFVGMQYQKQTGTAAAANGLNGKFANGIRGGMMRNRAIGTVKSIATNSITVTSRLDNSDKTYALTGSTIYKNGESTAQASDVQVGDTVLLTLDPSNTSNATTVTVNPTMMFRSSGSTNSATPNVNGGDDNATLQ